MTNPTTHVQEIYECQTCGPVILDAHGNCIKCGSSQVISTHKLDVVCESGEALPKEQQLALTYYRDLVVCAAQQLVEEDMVYDSRLYAAVRALELAEQQAGEAHPVEIPTATPTPTITLTEDELHAFVHQCVDNSHFHGTWYATVENYFNAKRKEQLNGTN